MTSVPMVAEGRMNMANKKPVNKDNPKNIYCDHCKHWNGKHQSYHITCNNPASPHYQAPRAYWNRCKCFEWKENI